mmetsp:Transcript_2387/g.5262  ORF Transcript_2387/g.5262 Transcript_2387/m.5262 type:complete len:363 (+) Transcript_2387:233-1321(+)
MGGGMGCVCVWGGCYALEGALRPGGRRGDLVRFARVALALDDALERGLALGQRLHLGRQPREDGGACRGLELRLGGARVGLQRRVDVHVQVVAVGLERQHGRRRVGGEGAHERDGHDGHPRLHGHREDAALERHEAARARAGALGEGEDADTVLQVGDALLVRAELPSSRRAVDEHVLAVDELLADERQAAQLVGRDELEVLRDQDLRHQRDVEPARVVGHVERRPRPYALEVFLAGDRGGGAAAHRHVEPGPGLADAVVEEPLLVPPRLLANLLAHSQRRPPERPEEQHALYAVERAEGVDALALDREVRPALLRQGRLIRLVVNLVRLAHDKWPRIHCNRGSPLQPHAWVRVSQLEGADA